VAAGERRSPGPAPGREQQEVGAMPHERQADDDARERPLQDQVDAGGVQHADEERDREHHAGSSAPSVRRMPSTRPMTTRYTPMSKNSADVTCSVPMTGTSRPHFAPSRRSPPSSHPAAAVNVEIVMPTPRIVWGLSGTTWRTLCSPAA